MFLYVGTMAGPSAPLHQNSFEVFGSSTLQSLFFIMSYILPFYIIYKNLHVYNVVQCHCSVLFHVLYSSLTCLCLYHHANANQDIKIHTSLCRFSLFAYFSWQVMALLLRVKLMESEVFG